MITVHNIEFCGGYSAWEHLVDSRDRNAAAAAALGRAFRSRRLALTAARDAFAASCDRRCRDAASGIRIRISGPRTELQWYPQR